MAFYPEFQQDPSRPHQCIHVNSDGIRCRSYAIRNEFTCFHHRIEGITVFSNDAFSLEDAHDHESIQRAVADVLTRIAANQMDLKRAGILLYGLQIASSNLAAQLQTPAETPVPAPDPPPAPPSAVILSEAKNPRILPLSSGTVPNPSPVMALIAPNPSALIAPNPSALIAPNPSAVILSEAKNPRIL